jgi:hypothetical protein
MNPSWIIYTNYVNGDHLYERDEEERRHAAPLITAKAENNAPADEIEKRAPTTTITTTAPIVKAAAATTTTAAKCTTKGLPSAVQLFACQVINDACFAFVKPKTELCELQSSLSSTSPSSTTPENGFLGVMTDLPQVSGTSTTNTQTVTPTCTAAPTPTRQDVSGSTYTAPDGVKLGIDCHGVYDDPQGSFNVAYTATTSFKSCLDYCSAGPGTLYVNHYEVVSCYCQGGSAADGFVNSPADVDAHVIN